MLMFLFLLLSVIFGGLVWFIRLYRRILGLRQVAMAYWAELDQIRQGRHELVRRVIEMTRYAVNSDGWNQVAKLEMALKAAQRIKGLEKIAKMEQQLSDAAFELKDYVAAVPPKWNAKEVESSFVDLTDIDFALASSRQAYNVAVAAYNSELSQTPQKWVAQFFGFGELTFLDLPTRADAQIQLSLADHSGTAPHV